MTTWQHFSREAPELAAAVEARFRATKHHVLATLRRDGSPRVSGTEVDFRGPDLVIGSMLGALKARDLQRDGRFAIHANPGDGSMEGGDAKISGRAVEVADAGQHQAVAAEKELSGTFHLFRLELSEAVLTSIAPGGDALLIQLWRPGERPVTFERR